ncbi:MAG: asparagine--tRNA ligase [Bacilli bacterium]|nr:asparagine--tRNA ligase [Bacilli bacterium]MDD3304826.1 asparagine--tRNA ligase [Bacilli bacterium]MDD4053413.1 asparagine--tRNA ligase [Bacilli bacterium]MDD4410940.1 asparagine--tRNA ligase [Bacilli bacterium]
MIMDIKELYESDYVGKEVVLQGWIRSHRKQKEFGFIDFYDGTCFKSIQVVYEKDVESFDDIQKFRVGSAIMVEGTIVESPGSGQSFEVKAKSIILEGDSPEDYLIQPKRHTREYLREVAYLRPRTNLFQAVFRVRSIAAHAIHTFFQDRGYVYLHAPIITGSDAEGAGEMFQVTNFDLDKVPRTEDGKIDYSKDFFGKKASLTVSGQLQGEIFALAFKRIYTFGPTFRAENSHTKTHASEFWMIEPEVAFTDLTGIMDIEEDFLKYIISYVLEHAKSEMEFFDKWVEPGIVNKLQAVVDSKAVRITHKEAIDILLSVDKKWEVLPEHGEDIATEHEKYLTEEKFKSPVFVTDWPKDIKAFYMRLNDDKETVAAVDLLVPGAGELMGGSQREERFEVLTKIMDEKGVSKEELDWYLNLRKYGGVKHAGFGMGFERLLIYLTGVENIRDVIPFPRTPNNCEF